MATPVLGTPVAMMGNASLLPILRFYSAKFLTAIRFVPEIGVDITFYERFGYSVNQKVKFS